MTKPVKPKTLTPGVVKLQTLTPGDHFTLVGLEDLGPWDLHLTSTCATVRSLTTFLPHKRLPLGQTRWAA